MNPRAIKRPRLMQRLPIKPEDTPEDDETMFKNIRVGSFGTGAKLNVGGIVRGSPNWKRPPPGSIRTLTEFLFATDEDNVLWISFGFLTSRVNEYTIRCDIDSIDVSQLSEEFKVENDLLRPEFDGDSMLSEYIAKAWALAFLNPCLRGQQDLLIRAVIGFYHYARDPYRSSRRMRVLEAAGWEQAAPSRERETSPIPLRVEASDDSVPLLEPHILPQSLWPA